LALFIEQSIVKAFKKSHLYATQQTQNVPEWSHEVIFFFLGTKQDTLFLGCIFIT